MKELKCKRSPGSILYDDPRTKKKIIDQLSDEPIEIFRTKISKYLMNTYGITLREYYNIIMYDDISYNNICKTNGCNKYTEFVNLSEGYREHCCNSCHITDRNNKNWKDNIYRDSMNRVLKENNNIPKTKIESEYNKFINYGKYDYPCYFYIGISKDLSKIKFGITRKGLWDRMYRYNLFTIHLILVGTAKQVADLERYLKYSLNSKVEWIDFLEIRKIFILIKDYFKID